MKTHTVKKYSVSDKQPGAALKAATGGKAAKPGASHTVDTKFNCGHGGSASDSKRKGYSGLDWGGAGAASGYTRCRPCFVVRFYVPVY